MLLTACALVYGPKYRALSFFCLLAKRILQLRVRNDVLEAGDLFHHLVDLRPSPHDLTKIRADAIVEVHRLAHINDRIPLIVHNIYARLRRELFQFFLHIKHFLCSRDHSPGLRS